MIALGLSVDYSAHIGHSYLTSGNPSGTRAQKRKIKTVYALSKIGPGIFHGGFSTFLAIITVSPSNFYMFIVFFKAWFGIVLFGMANGFMLLPVLLSICGPVEGDETLNKVVDEKTQIDHFNSNSTLRNTAFVTEL